VTLFDSPRQARRFVRDLLIALSVPLLIVIFLAQPFRVEGRSMRPILDDGERILVEKMTPRFGLHHRGDIVVFRSPADPRRLLVKRIVGLPGESIALREGRLLTDGQPLRENYLTKGTLSEGEFGPTTLGPDEYFVLGDNRSDSEDSRSWGPVSSRLMIGRAIVSYWPPALAGSLG
jgi:signal peptidase I